MGRGDDRFEGTWARSAIHAMLLCTSLAQASAPETPAKTLEEVVVIGSRIERSNYQVPQAVSRLDRAEIQQRSYRTTPESLAHQPGITVQKTAHGHGSPFIRGLTGKQVLILVDGVRLNNATFRFGPNQYLNTVDVGVIERIETLRGPASALYGSDALGGVLNIITRQAGGFSQPLHGETQIGYGSADDEQSVRVDIGAAGDTLAFAAAAAYRDFSDLRAGGDVGTQRFSGYNEYHANAALAYRFGEDGRINLSLQKTHQNNVPRTDKFTNSNESQYFDPQERTAATLQLQLDTDIPIADRIHGTLSYQVQSESLTRQKFGSDRVINVEDEVSTYGFTLQADRMLPRSGHTLTYGLELYRDEVASGGSVIESGIPGPGAGSFPDGSSYTTSALYIHDEYALSARSAILAGIRYSRFRATAQLPSFGRFAETYDDVTASARWSAEVRPGLRVFAGISGGSRAPNLDDLVVLKSTNEGIDVPSPGLAPEQAVNYEVGMKVSADSWIGSVVVYHTDFSDLIERRPGSYQGLGFFDANGDGQRNVDEEPVVKKFNIGSARMRGIELDARYVVSDQLQAFGNIAYANGRNETDGEPLSRVPPLRTMLGLRWQATNRNLWLEPLLELVSRQDRLSARDQADPRIPDAGTPGYATMNLRGGLTGQKHTLTFAFNNIADRKYRVHGSGLYGPGRELKLSYARRF